MYSAKKFLLHDTCAVCRQFKGHPSGCKIKGKTDSIYGGMVLKKQEWFENNSSLEIKIIRRDLYSFVTFSRSQICETGVWQIKKMPTKMCLYAIDVSRLKFKMIFQSHKFDIIKHKSNFQRTTNSRKINFEM